MDYLNRAQAPFSRDLWKRIDDAAVTAARDVLTGRRFLEVEGPFGAGLTSIEVGADDFCRQVGEDEAGAVISQAISVPMLRKTFKLSIRRLEAVEAMGQPLNLAPAEDAAEAVARREEEFIYYGQSDFNLAGLLTARGRNDVKLHDWSQSAEAPLDDLLKAANALDQAGFFGPYALALEPVLYNALFRRYEGTDMLQLSHIRRLCEIGVFKAPIKGGALVDPRTGPLLVGQDLRTGYVGQDGIHYQLFVSESLVLRVDEPTAICTLTLGK